MFELRNVRAEAKLIACAEDGETVHAIDLFCKLCGEQINSKALDTWLTREFPLVLMCSFCGAHTVINFSELEELHAGQELA